MSLKELKTKQLSESLKNGSPVPIENIGQKIQDIRTAMGLTQKQLAKRIKMSQPLLSRIEKNAGSCTLKTIARVVKALNCEFLGIVISRTDLIQQVRAQAEKKAKSTLKRIFSNMAMEKQAPGRDAYNFQLKNLVEKLANDPGPELWED